jgi:hypothetical protein
MQRYISKFLAFRGRNVEIRKLHREFAPVKVSKILEIILS